MYRNMPSNVKTDSHLCSFKFPILFCAAPVDPGGHTRSTNLIFNRLCNCLRRQTAINRTTERITMPHTMPTLLMVLLNNSGADLPTRSPAPGVMEVDKQKAAARHRASHSRAALPPTLWLEAASSTKLRRFMPAEEDLATDCACLPRSRLANRGSAEQGLCHAVRQRDSSESPAGSPDLLGGHGLTPVSSHVVYWDSGRT